MSEESLFQSTVKVITRNVGMSNDPAEAGSSYAVDDLAASDTRIVLLAHTRFVTTGNVTFLVGRASVHFDGATFPVLQDADMDPNTQEIPETWINTREIIAILEDS